MTARPMAARLVPHLFGIDIGGLLHRVASAAVALWFDAAVHFVARMDANTVEELWRAVDATTEPVTSGPSWSSEFTTMSVIAAGVMLPLLCAAALQAVARQDASGLLRTAFVRVPLALLLTGVVVELVSLGVQATDQACAALMDGAAANLHGLFEHMNAFFGGASVTALSLNFLCLLLAGFFAFIVWIELAVRSAAVAVATLFLPLALAGSALPATAHWARRLGETLAALVLSKLAIVATLTLAVGAALDLRGGISSVVEGITLFGLAAIAPLALARMLPMIESGATAHLDSIGRHGTRTVASAVGTPISWMTSSSKGGRKGGGPPGAAKGGPEGGAAAGAGGVAESALGGRARSVEHPMPAPRPASPPTSPPTTPPTTGGGR